jgi:hypothetical protein
MKLRLTILGRTPGGQPTAWVWELERMNPMLAYLHFANGLDWQTRVEGDTQEALVAARGLATGAGSCTRLDPVSLAPEVWLGRCLYREGDECYAQGALGAGPFLFIDPTPLPDIA